MTSLAISLSVDSRGPCALYIITDSRITWGNTADRWDGGQKTFCSRRFPDIFGYCGDAYFPPMMLSQIIEQLDSGLLCRDSANPKQRHQSVLSAMDQAIKRISGNPPSVDFSIFHGARAGSGMQSAFVLWETRYLQKNGQWIDNPRDIVQTHSHLAQIDGSGAQSITRENDKWQATSAAQTSRSSVWSFFDSLRSKADKYRGGPPQMVGLWRVGSGRHFGLVWNGWPYVAGLRAFGNLSNAEFRWFDDSFEPCNADGKRMKPDKAHFRPTPPA
jgi:hypothetical protein